jgi:DoxX.
MTLSSLRNAKTLSVLRIVFGFIWLIDAAFKWNPAFINGMVTSMAKHQKGQLLLAKDWITLWMNVVSTNPHLFGYLVAIAETVLAIALILGLFGNLTNIGGLLFSLGIWSTAEGFGGPYAPGKTDIGTCLIYALVFAFLLFTQSNLYYSIDNLLRNKLGAFNFLVPAAPETTEQKAEDATPAETEAPTPVHA